MKTEEDEAFDDIARKQGAWGGGFTAKRQMAMDKINDEFREEYIKYRTAFPKEYTAPQPAEEWLGQSNIASLHNACQHRGYCRQLQAQSAQEPVQREWVGLTAEEIEGCLHHVDDEAVLGLPDFARAVEQLLKEKNNGL